MRRKCNEQAVWEWMKDNVIWHREITPTSHYGTPERCIYMNELTTAEPMIMTELNTRKPGSYLSDFYDFYDIDEPQLITHV